MTFVVKLMDATLVWDPMTKLRRFNDHRSTNKDDQKAIDLAISNHPTKLTIILNPFKPQVPSLDQFLDMEVIVVVKP